MASWKSILKGLPLSQKEKAQAFEAFFALGWSDAKISKYCEDAYEVGEEVLIEIIRDLPRTAGPSSSSSEDSTPKTVYILHEKTEDEEIIYKKSTFVFKNEAVFSRVLGNGGYLTPLKQLQDKSTELGTVICYEQLEQGQTYVLCYPESLHQRIKALKKYVNNEAHAGEDEFACSMLNELKSNAFARDPVLRNDLRRHCKGTPEEQEFDVVILDGEDRAFFGSAKHTGRGTSIIDSCLREVNKVVYRRENLERFSSYAEFRGRLLGCCVRVDWIQDKAHDAVVDHCWRNGVGLFCRSGHHALTMRPFPFSAPGYVQQIGIGFLNLAIGRKLMK